MLKYAYITIILVILFFTALGQRDRDGIEISRLTKIGNQLGTKNKQYLLVQLLHQNSSNEKELIKLSSRQISESLYIIDKDSYKKIRLNAEDHRIYNDINNEWKLSKTSESINSNFSIYEKDFLFTIKTLPGFSAKNIIKYKGISSSSIHEFAQQNIISIKTNWNFISKYLLDLPEIISIDVTLKPPKEELAIKGFDLSANKINRVHNNYPGITGKGQHVSIKENYYDTADIDLKGRIDISPLASNIITNHANFMATIIAGGGNSVYYSRGAAWGANISSSSFDLILPDPDTYYKSNSITVQNHSYGTDIENQYGVNAIAFDNSAQQNQDLLHVFSSGNSGTSSSSSGYYSGISGFANVTGNFKMAKNNLVIGASDSFGNVVSLSSRGPAYDGRIKPELVAFQMNGTSEAAALVSGSVLLLQQFYKKRNNINLSSALAKGLLINSADDVNTPGPDFATGYGNMNLSKAMDEIENNWIWSDTITPGNTKHFTIAVPSNVWKLKVSLTWNDTTAKTFAPKALVNDLDLLVTYGNISWKPWVLNSFANADSLLKPAERKRDSLNNVEQVTIDYPPGGNYDISVTGFDLKTANQAYFITYSYDTLNSFKWVRPGSMDFLNAGKLNLIRWESTFTNTGILEYRYSGSNTWATISGNIDLTTNNLQITVPDTTSQIIYRMTIGSKSYLSDTFQIAKLLSPKIGYVCKDSLLMYWEKLPGIGTYQIYQFGGKYMEAFKTVSDTSAIINKKSLNNNFLAVGPVMKNGNGGIKSYAFDYTTQGAACYINSFLAERSNNSAHLSLLLGTGYQVEKITFETLMPLGFVAINTQPYTHNLEFQYIYTTLLNGFNLFRAKIILSNGQIIYSDIVSVAYVQDDGFKLLPVPVKRSQPLQLISASPSREVFQILDATGRLLYEKLIILTVESISTSRLTKGNYYYRIIKDGKETGRGRFMIL